MTLGHRVGSETFLFGHQYPVHGWQVPGFFGGGNDETGPPRTFLVWKTKVPL